MREAIFALTRGEVHDRGLARMLWHIVRDFREHTGLDADLVLVGDEPRLSRDNADALLAVAREGLANVEQHAHATSVVVILRTSKTGVTLAVHDDGIGAPALVLRSIASSATHFGLRGLRERIHKLGGTFKVRRAEDGGFVLRVRVPNT
jgi:signal transduction histidine kinase